MAHEGDQGLPGDALDLLALAFAVLLQEVIDERRDVVFAPPERRDGDADDVQAVEEVGPEPAFRHERVEVLVGRGDDADVGPERLVRAEPVELPVLEEAQELDLGLGGEVADLVEEDRAAGRGLELADLPFVGARVGPLFRAEELGLDQGLRERGDVQGDVGALLPG